MNRKYRKTIIAGNWKMNKTPAEAKELLEAIKPLVKRPLNPSCLRAAGATWCSASPLFAFPLPSAPCGRPGWALAART